MQADSAGWLPGHLVLAAHLAHPVSKNRPLPPSDSARTKRGGGTSSFEASEQPRGSRKKEEVFAEGVVRGRYRGRSSHAPALLFERLPALKKESLNLLGGLI